VVPWLLGLRTERNELTKRVRQLEAQLARVWLPPLLITTMPRSGTYYLTRLLTQGLSISSRIVSHQYFPYDVIRQPELRTFAQGSMVSQDHFGASRINLVHIAKHVDRMIVHVRDPRQAMLSWVHFLDTPQFRRTEDETLLFIYPPMPDDFYRRDLEARIDWAIENWLPLLIEWTEDWVVAAEALDRPLIKFTRYEDLVADRERFVRDMLQFFDIPVERYIPPRITNDQDIHFRKGEIAEWKTTFTPRQAGSAAARIPPALAKRFGWALEDVAGER
jgi:hypothetical protein